MTRNEVIDCFKRHLPMIVNANNVIDFYIETGMLKVEEEKTVAEKVIDVIGKIENKDTGSPLGGYTARSVLYKLDKAGLKIVEKDK